MSGVGEDSAFTFNGRWQEYAPIAFTNLLLTIVTLGIYRFWAKARTRRYLWAHTRFIDDHLEWSGTGGELFKGALMALVLIVLPLAIVNQIAQHLLLNGYQAAAGLFLIVQFVLLFYLVGVALFRSLRYRLSRTYWHGIRGGSADPGLRYGWSYVWRSALGSLSFGLLIPWSMVELWNQRWNAMSFGPYPFDSSGRVAGLMRRFLLCYLAPLVGLVAIAAIATFALVGKPTQPQMGAMVATMFFGILAVYVLIGVGAFAFYAKFFRQMIGAMRLHTLEFSFDARTAEWLKLLLGDVALVVLTFGIGVIFLEYRHWKFFVVHLEAHGEIDMDALTQSTTPEVSQGEGLLDAFDMGAL